MKDKPLSENNFIEESIFPEFKKGKVVALTGAGISEESGIPTFRGENGLWARYDPNLFASPEGLLSVLKERPQRIVDFLGDLYTTLFKARPNPAHLALMELEKRKILSCVITQNIDNLHQDAGSKKVWELHGNAFRLRCNNCGKIKYLNKDEVVKVIKQLKRSSDSRLRILKTLGRLFPRCACKGRFRIDVVLFGELLPPGVLENAYQEIENCSLLLMIGTSGSVYPAATLPIYAKERGIKILEINSEPSNLSLISDYRLMGKAGEILPGLAKKI